MDKKALTLPILISLVVGDMIGTGIYLLPAALATFGTFSLIAWVITSIGAIFLALTFANLSKRFQQTGGPYVYCKEAFGGLGGFVVAYIYWLSNLVSIAGIAVSSIGYLGFMIPSLNAQTAQYSTLHVIGLELGVVWLFTAINIIGIHTAGVVQLFLTIIKITPLILITLIGFFYINLDNLTHFTLANISTTTAISSAAALTFWAFIGLEAATIPAENTSGSRDISRATVYGALITAVIYISSTFVLMGLLSTTELRQSQFPFADAGILLFGGGAALLIAGCAVIAGLGSLNACVLIQGQIVFAAARDHLFPRAFAKLSKRDVPVAGQLLSSCIVSLFLMMTLQPSLLKQFHHIALLAGLLTLVTYFFTTLAEMKFLLQGKLSFSKLLFGKPLIVTLIATIYSIWMISNFKNDMLMIAAILLVMAVPIYFVLAKKLQKG